MTPNQIATYRNHHSNTAKYDQILVFSLQPPELLDVFARPKDYFRFYYKIEKKKQIMILNLNLMRISMNAVGLTVWGGNKVTYNWNRRDKEYDAR